MKITDLKFLSEEAFKWPANEDVEISLSNVVITREQIQQLAQVLKDPTCRLQTLKLKNCALDDKDIQTITDALQQNSTTTLKVLDLSENRISDQGAEKIAQLLQHNNMSSLHMLTLNYTNISGKGVEQIANAVNTTLPNKQFGTTVDFVGSFISLESAKKVASIFSEAYLDDRVNFHIDVTANKFSPEFQEFKKSVEEKLGTECFSHHKSTMPVYCDPVPIEAKFFQEYLGDKIRTLRTVSNASLLEQFDQKLQHLKNHFPESEKKQRLVTVLERLFNTVKSDLKIQREKIPVTENQKEYQKVLESPAMVILKETDQLLGTMLKEDKNFDLSSSIKIYYDNCKSVSNWSVWQQVVGAVAIGIISFFEALNPVAAPVMLGMINNIFGENPKYALYATEQLLHSTLGTKGMFFTPYNTFISEVQKSIEPSNQEPTAGNKEFPHPK